MNRKKAVVIGSGFGGLASAVRLQAAGLDVTILEKRAKVGGRAYQLVDRGYTFDMGPSLITAPGLLDEVFRAAGTSLEAEVDLVPLDPYYRIHFADGSAFDYVGDPERMRAQMTAFHPEDGEAYDRFMRDIRPIYDAVIRDRLGSTPFDDLGTMLSFVPKIFSLGAYRSAYGFVSRYFKDERHRFLYSFHPLFVGGNPFKTPAIYLMIPYLEREGGVWFTRGGMYTLVEAFARTFRRIGGKILTDHEVEKVEVRDGQVTSVVAGGRVFEADIVVSNADVEHLHRHLLAPDVGGRASRRERRYDQSMSCFLLYLGTKRTYPELAHHTLILSERYESLLTDIFDRKILPDDFSMYLHVPTRTDPGMAPEGCESMYVLVPVANNRSGIDWSVEGPAFTDRVLAFLEDWGMTDLRANLEVLHTFTPDDFATELNATDGNAFALVPKLTQTGWFRPHNRSRRARGLYLVGAGTHPGAGVPGVVLSAAATYATIAEDLGLEAQWDPASPGTVALEEHGMPSAEALAL